MTAPGIPVAVVERVVLHDDGTETWEARCPHCRRLHTHGGEPGWRVPHCGHGDQYRLHLDQQAADFVVADPTPARRTR